MFEIGKLVLTKMVYNLISENDQFISFVNGSLAQYIGKSWGDTCKEDSKQNDYAVKNGERILAVYKFPKDHSWHVDGEDSIWIITEWDRSVTTILFPGEY